MDKFDYQRVENAIWLLDEYEYSLIEILPEVSCSEYDYHKVFSILREIRYKICEKI